MFQIFYICCISAILAAVQGILKTDCKKYKSSAMCLRDNTAFGISPNVTERQAIVDLHNHFRGTASPNATNMQRLIWDDDVAGRAYKWAKQCTFTHDSLDSRKIPSYGFVGQNMFAGTAKQTWTTAVTAFHNEFKYFTYGQKSDNAVGHYTQVMYSGSARVGCGGAYCPYYKWKYIYVCNYILGQMNYLTPYKTGETCADCPKSCKNGLCDCNGRYCKNGGFLDLNTCICKCRGIYKGDECDQKHIPAKDPWMCRFYHSFYCKPKYGNVISDICPNKCTTYLKGT